MRRPNLVTPKTITAILELDTANPEAMASAIDFIRKQLAVAQEADSAALTAYFEDVDALTTELTETRKGIVDLRAASDAATKQGRIALRVLANPNDPNTLQEAESAGIAVTAISQAMLRPEVSHAVPADAAVPDAAASNAQQPANPSTQSAPIPDEAVNQKLRALEAMLAAQTNQIKEMEEAAKAKAALARKQQLEASLMQMLVNGVKLSDGSVTTAYPDSIQTIIKYFDAPLSTADIIPLRGANGVETQTTVLASGVTLENAIVAYASDGGAGFRLFQRPARTTGSMASHIVGDVAAAAGVQAAAPTVATGNGAGFSPLTIVRGSVVVGGRRGGYIDTLAISRAVKAAHDAGDAPLALYLEGIKTAHATSRANGRGDLFLEF